MTPVGDRLREFRILNCDVLDGLRQIEPGTVDAIVTDPPYGENNAAWDAPRSIEWHCAWVELATLAAKPGAPLVTFCSRKFVDVVMGALRCVRGDSGELTLQTGAWVHRQGFTAADGLLRPEHEPFIVSGRLRVDSFEVRRLREYRTEYNRARKPTRRGAVNRKRFGTHTYIPDETGPVGGTIFDAARNIPAERTEHPTQKPEAIAEYLVVLASAPGDLVLDPFAGSGTVGVVALRHGRRFVGCELNPDYARMARERIIGDAPLLNREVA